MEHLLFGSTDLPLRLAYAALVCTAASGALALLAPVGRTWWVHTAPFLALLAAGLLSVAAGAPTLIAGLVLTDRFALGLPWMAWHLRLDALSGFFLVLLGTLLAAIALYGPRYTREFARGARRQPLAPLGVFTAVFVLGMQMVLLADDAFTFLVFWELMSLGAYLLVTYQHQHGANRRAGFLFLLLAHLGALAILIAFGVLAAFGDGFTFAHMRAAGLTSFWATLAFACALAGFGSKAGLVPLHAWLPEAHPAAPSHISALMSGAMIKLGIYGLVRLTYDLIGAVRWEWGVVLLVLGTASALLGVLYALVQHDLKRLLAYHSIENIGIILIGLGLSMIFLGTGQPVIGALGLVAALYHALNHALFKGLLFLGAGAVLYRTHERDLEHMGGLIRRMPVTAFMFLVGCVAISALPPFNGFVSEWLTFQTALQAPRLENGVLRAVIPIAAALLALSAALAAACFVKAFGVAFLGRARSRRAARAREVSLGMRAGMGLLAGACFLLGVLPTLALGALTPLTRLLTGTHLPSATAHGWLWLTPIDPRIASYSAPFVVAAVAAALVLGWWLLKRRARPARRGPAWDCGFGGLGPRMQYSATAFAMPIRRVFAPAWKIEERIEKEAPDALGRARALRYRLQALDWSWLKGYLPVARLVLAAARRIGALQAGSIHAYLIYSLVTLLLLLWIVR